ncbi:hypothetical protein ACJMK2_006475, partial [Sinanodonta woodiana]
MEVKQMTMFCILMIVLVVGARPSGEVVKECVARRRHCRPHEGLMPYSPEWYEKVKLCSSTE